MKHGRRLRHIFASNVHALLERAEDPLKMLRALQQEIDELLVELEGSERELRTDLKVLERELAALERRIAARQADAEAALTAGDEERARAVVERRMTLEAEQEALAGQVARCREALDRVSEDRQRLRERREEAATQGRRLAGQVIGERVERRYRTGADRCLERSRERMGRIEARLARMEARIEAWDEAAEPVGKESEARAVALDAELDRLRRRVTADPEGS